MFLTRATTAASANAGAVAGVPSLHLQPLGKAKTPHYDFVKIEIN